MSEHEPPHKSPEAGPSSAPATRSTTPHPPSSTQRLRRPASHSRLAKLMQPGRSRSGSTSQQETTVTAYAEDAPASNGRSTPEQRWRSSRAATSSLLASDAKYKKFASQVDKSLQYFENVNEWADFISFLSRLLKTLQQPSPPYTEIPRKLLVAKRLAQCLNPALPSGVHQRALDVYSHIFSTIGTDGLRRDLLIWSSGLFPFFQSAATSVRPIILNIYQTYYLPLGEDLRPATKAIILALLPGIEEETGDFFDNTLSILSRISDAVSPTFFLQNVFLVLLSSPASRLAALNYLARKLTAPPVPSDGTDVGLMVRGVAAVLEDDNSLVRRGGLDLLLRILPLDGELLKDADKKDKQLLVRAAIAVVLQREISLSRRVYSWLLGKEESNKAQEEYFKARGLDLVTQTIEGDIVNLRRSEDDAHRPFKVFLSLLDKWEIGASLSERLAIPTLQALQRAAQEGITPREDVIVTASAVYDAIEPVIIWRELFTSFKDRGDANLLSWLLSNVTQKDEEIARLHIPVMLDYVLGQIEESGKGDAALANLLLRHVDPVLFTRAPSTTPIGEAQVFELLYAGQTAPEDLYDRVATEAFPQAVQRVFRLTTKSDMSAQSRLLVLKMAGILIDHEAVSIAEIKGQTWIQDLLSSLRKVTSFPLVDAVVSTTLKASHSQALSSTIDVATRQHMSDILDSLFRFLGTQCTAYHVRAVDLLWEYNKLAKIHTLENVIAKQMTNALTKRSNEAIEAFGTLWRFTDDAMLPGEIFYVPVSIVLDSLRSADPVTQANAETWMRCSLTSYFRILDPILTRLIDSGAGDPTSRGAEVSSAQALVDNIGTLLKFGGKGLSKACQAQDFTRSTHPTLAARGKTVTPTATSYLDLVVTILSQLLLAESPASRPTDRALRLRIQSSTLDVLQTLVSYGDLSKSESNTLKSALLAKLSASTKAGQTTLQSKLLRLLHGLLTVTPAPPKAHRRSTSLTHNPEKTTDHADEFDRHLVQVVIEGVSSKRNRPVLQHWVDFILMSAQSIHSRRELLEALGDCLAIQVRGSVLELGASFEAPSADRAISEAEPVMLLSALERLASLSGPPNAARNEDGKSGNEGGSGLFGLVSGVFIADSGAEEKPRAQANDFLANAVEALLVAWTVTVPKDVPGPVGPSRAQAMTRVRSRARKVLENMFKSYTGAVVGSAIGAWADPEPDIEDSAIFDCIDTLTPSAQRVVEIISNGITAKQRGSGESGIDRPAMAFLEAYICQLEAPIAVQIWGTLFSFARELLASATTPPAKAGLYPVLRCLTVLCKTVTTTSALEDRRLRRDLQEVYPKLLEAVVVNSARVGEVDSWKRGNVTPEQEKDGLQDLYAFLSTSIIPSLRSFLIDPDKVSSSCSVIFNSAVAPALKQYRQDSAILKMILEMTHLPPATKAWRAAVGDAFNDSRFFTIDEEAAAYWKPLVCALMDSDKERFGELLGRITAAPSANIFTNREQEMMTRSSNLRRLSFVLLAAEENHYLTQLPGIQEKLVDILRTNVVSPRVHSEVYLCLRVLMCRISPQHLSNFWPVILGELIRVFEEIMDEVPADGSESLQLSLAACKFLDLLLVIQSEDFQIHQWMFITDTTDAACPPEHFSPEAMMDTIAEILRDQGLTLKTDLVLHLEESSGPRRPRLAKVKGITSIQQLEPFFSRSSIDTFEGVYRGEGVDWTAVEEGLSEEVFA